MSERRGGKPTLWVRDAFARDVDLSTKEHTSRDPETIARERTILDIFTQRGIRIKRSHHSGNERRGRRDAGFKSRESTGIPYFERHRVIWEAAGATVPQAYDARDVLAAPGPVVAKIMKVHRGEGKYLLRTREDKLRVIAFSILKSSILTDIYNDTDRESRKRKMAAIFEKIEKGETDGPEFIEYGGSRLLTFHDYIETPSDRYVSFRIVPDAFGVIHSMLLLYSGNDKTNLQPQRQESTNPRVQFYDKYLLNPASPFCITSTPIISYTRDGGIINLMYPQKPKDAHEQALQREILEAHGLNPDKPELPEQIIELSKALGRGFRFEYPYTGLDFIVDKHTGKWYLIEMNNRPELDASEIGLSNEQYTPEQAELILIERIADEMVS